MPQDFRKDQPKLEGVSWDMVHRLSFLFILILSFVYSPRARAGDPENKRQSEERLFCGPH